MKMRKFRAFVAAALGVTCAFGAAQAETAPDRVFQVTPYLWATGVGGEIRPFTSAPTVSISTSFSDLIKDLDAAFFVSAYARYGNLVFMGDISASSSSRSGTFRGPGFDLPATGRLRQNSVTALAGYRVVHTQEATFDILGGARFWRVRGAVETPLRNASRRVSFTDPIIAARANIEIAPGWSGILYADLGGFGVGSRGTAQVLGTVNYQLRENAFLSVGYRHLRVNYHRGGTRFDMRMSGPILGATLRF